MTGGVLGTINDQLARQGLLLREGTLVDATLIAAPPLIRNRDWARDPDRHATQKGQQWHFGMKAHIGVDADSGLVHTRVTTPAHVHDVTQAPALLQGQERYAAGDAGHQGVDQRRRPADTTVHGCVAMRPGRRRQLDRCTEVGRLLDAFERIKARLCAQVEHPFHVIKHLFKYRKTRYRGLARNTAQLQILFGLANRVIAGWRLRARNALRVS